MTAGEFATYVTAVVVALWLIAASTLAPFFGPIAALVGVWSAVIFLNWQRQKRIEAFIGQLPDVARLLANATAAALPCGPRWRWPRRSWRTRRARNSHTWPTS
ncbi:hypothetical protein ACFQ51_26665 [Streptomyces kaempferi]